MKLLGESAGRLRSKGKSRKGLSAKAGDESPSDSLRALSRHLAKIPHSGGSEGEGKRLHPQPCQPRLPPPGGDRRLLGRLRPSPGGRVRHKGRRGDPRPSPGKPRGPPRAALTVRDAVEQGDGQHPHAPAAAPRPPRPRPGRSRQAARTGSGRLGRGLLAACGATGPRSERSAPPAALRGLKVGEKARRAKEKPPRCAVQGKFVRGAGCVRTKCMLPRRRRHAGGATGEKYYVGLFIGRCLPFLRTFDQSYKTVFSKEGSRILTFFVCSILAES